MIEMRSRLRPLPLLLPCALFTAPAIHAQAVESTVRTEYAEVLSVEPVYLPAPAPDDAAQCAPMLALEPDPAARARADTGTECIPLESGRTPSGPQVLYDVDYVLRGVKYRSRLPYDPGNRLQVRLSVTPLLPHERP